MDAILNEYPVLPLTMNDLKTRALAYHELPRPGKICVAASKPCATQAELSLAYTPGVAEPVREIARDPALAYRYTGKGNLVAVVTDGTAILGLGNLGALAAKPVMEGKAVLFKRFANIDVFDIEIKADSVEEFIRTVINISPTFGGINLEDIAAPHCFEIERRLTEALDIPVFHDDQHGTAVIICAGLINAVHIQDKRLDEVKIVCLGAGAAGIASMDLLLELGVPRQHITLVDSRGVIHAGRNDLNPFKQAFARQTDQRTLEEAMRGADVFVGVSGPNLVTPAMVRSMAGRPVVFALANPDPEILPLDAHTARSDLIMATGRSDFPNQVNNVLGFPYIFRGALDTHARRITKPMLVAAARALAELAREPVPAAVLQAYGVDRLAFGREYILPKPFDPRLIERVPAAVAAAV